MTSMLALTVWASPMVGHPIFKAMQIKMDVEITMRTWMTITMEYWTPMMAVHQRLVGLAHFKMTGIRMAVTTMELTWMMMAMEFWTLLMLV